VCIHVCLGICMAFIRTNEQMMQMGKEYMEEAKDKKCAGAAERGSAARRWRQSERRERNEK